jgi:hypothetical protein
MELKSGKQYPNGIPKSALFGIFLSCRDFGYGLDDYRLDLALVRQAEINGEEHCHWYEDTCGRMIVANLSLVDNSKVVQIIPGGFRLVPASHRIFISYAKEDSDHAKQLYEVLKGVGVSPWLDEENLLPGQRWDIEIEAEIEQCNYFIALLSSRSVAKRGYVQVEIRRALDVLEKFPERDIYLIPARIDECQPSHRALNGIHWVDMFPSWDAGVTRILRALGFTGA